jgi:hypothetical protein
MFQSFSTTGIGSLPHTDPVEACNIVLDSVDIPFWPQLPHRSFLELMVPQYSEGFPFVKIDGENIYVKKAEDGALTKFYEDIANNVGFPTSKEYAAGLFTFIDILKERGKRYETVKGHATGPLTFTLGLTDEEKRPIYFDEEMRELAFEFLKGKISWQIELLKPFCDKVLFFIDEPILTALGSSSYVGVSTEEALRLLKGTIQHIKDCGAVAGIHCCGKADWPLALSTGLDVFNFDAYFFWNTLSIYPEEMKTFIDNNGYIAWGVVPTTEAIREVDIQILNDQLERGLTSLEEVGISRERLRDQVILTPSCGTGSLVPDDALKVFSFLKELKERYVSG